MTKKELFEKEPKKGLEWIQIMIQLKILFWNLAMNCPIRIRYWNQIRNSKQTKPELDPK